MQPTASRMLSSHGQTFYPFFPTTVKQIALLPIITYVTSNFLLVQTILQNSFGLMSLCPYRPLYVNTVICEALCHLPQYLFPTAFPQLAPPLPNGPTSYVN